jgi:hypothetical protein
MIVSNMPITATRNIASQIPAQRLGVYGSARYFRKTVLRYTA